LTTIMDSNKDFFMFIIPQVNNLSFGEFTPQYIEKVLQ
jgi:hypothetical protein